MSADSPSRASAGIDLQLAWDDGLPLSEAIFFFAEEYQQNQFREAGTRNRSDALIFLMKEDLRLRLHSGELTAVGVQVAPDVRSEPEILPAVIFHEHDAIWAGSEISRSPWKYIAVRIIQPELPRRLSMDVVEPVREAPKASGRPSVSEFLDTVVGQLRLDEGFIANSQKEQIARVGDLARNHYPGVFKRAGTPARQTIIDALARNGLTISSRRNRK